MDGNKAILKCLAIACLIFNSINISICETKSKDAKIVIIGAGASGIAAAAKLLENGFNHVTLLEAENRIGGRINTTKLGSYTVDLGAQWVDGEEGNVAFELAYPLGLLDKSDKPYFGVTSEFFDSLGNRMSDSVSKKIVDFFFEYGEAIDAYNDTSRDETLGQYVTQKFDETFKDDPEIFKDKDKYLSLLELFAIGSIAADTWNNISVSTTEPYRECKGDHFVNWKEAGYSKILDVLMKSYPDPTKELPVKEKTLLNTEVKSIDYSKTDGDAPITITTTGGDTFKADHVIVTMSLGVLKDKYKTLFTPALPDDKAETIEGLAFGTIGKIFILFDEPIFKLGDSRVEFVSFVWNDGPEKEALEKDPEKWWTLGMNGITTVEHKPNLLELWLAGKYVRAMEQLPEDKVLSHTMETLNRFLSKKYKIPKPLGMLRSQWYSNPHFRGTYSYRSMKTQKTNTNAKKLQEPLSPDNLKILFAGEATSTDRYGMVDEAIVTGWRAANKIIDHYNKNA